MPAGTSDDTAATPTSPQPATPRVDPVRTSQDVNAFEAAVDQVNGRLPGSSREVNQPRRDPVRSLHVTTSEGSSSTSASGASAPRRLIESGTGAGTTRNSCASTVAATEPGQNTSRMGPEALKPNRV